MNSYPQTSKGAAVFFEKLNTESGSLAFWESTFLNKKICKKQPKDIYYYTSIKIWLLIVLIT